MKKPWLASLLNIFPYPLGFGYLYLGHPSRFTLALFAGAVAGLIGFVGGGLSSFVSGSDLELFVATAWAPVLVAIFSAADSWRLALANNDMGNSGPDDKGKGPRLRLPGRRVDAVVIGAGGIFGAVFGAVFGANASSGIYNGSVDGIVGGIFGAIVVGVLGAIVGDIVAKYIR